MSAKLDEFILTQTVIASAPLVPEIQLHLATELSPLWTATAALLERLEVPPPFWAFPWVGGQAVARYVLDHPELVRGKRVFDFASGSGLCGIAASQAGALSVCASDIDRVACVAIRRNARPNGVLLELDDEDRLGAELPGVEVLLAGDIFYERQLAARGLAWFTELSRRGVLVLAGDPGRIYSPASGRTELARYEVAANPEVEEGTVRTPVVYRI